MYFFFIVLVVCEQGVCNVVKRLTFAGEVQLNNFTSGSVHNDCSLSYSHESRVPVFKIPLRTSPPSISLPVLHKTGWTLQSVDGYAPREHQLSWRLGNHCKYFTVNVPGNISSFNGTWVHCHHWDRTPLDLRKFWTGRTLSINYLPFFLSEMLRLSL